MKDSYLVIIRFENLQDIVAYNFKSEHSALLYARKKIAEEERLGRKTKWALVAKETKEVRGKVEVPDETPEYIG